MSSKPQNYIFRSEKLHFRTTKSDLQTRRVTTLDPQNNVLRVAKLLVRKTLFIFRTEIQDHQDEFFEMK